MHNKDSHKDHHQEHHSIGEEIRHAIRERFTSLLNWYKPRAEYTVLKNILITIAKTPVILFILLLSPFALIIVLFTFIAAF